MRRGLPAYSLARLCGVNDSNYSKIELGRKAPSPRVIRILESKFGKPISELLSFA